ncbi:MAG TPA: VCBS repeat-containing protein [Herpetosiphonaceae bacterium]|nr:VCBS repeat-containing protein [Herpetosiphonaceae bacterium]
MTADSSGCVWAFDATGKLLPGFPWKTGSACTFSPRINAPLAIGDLTGDGVVEIVAGTRGSGPNAGQRGKVYVWNIWGKVRTGWPKEMEWAYIDNGNEPEVMSVAIGDITGDGKPEVIANTSNEAGSNTNYAPNVYAWTPSGALVSGYPKSSDKGSGSWGQLALGDLDKNGKAEVVIGRDEIYFYAYNGQGQNMAGWPVRTYVDQNKTTWGTDMYMEFTRSAAAVADLDGDGANEVVMAGKVRNPALGGSDPFPQSNSGVLVLGVDGSRRPGWETAKLSSNPIQTSFTPNNQVVLADLDGDNKLEIIVTFDDGTIRAFRRDGTQLWIYNYANGLKLFASEVVVGDVSGDGKPDIVFGTYSPDGSANQYGYMLGLNGSGQLLPDFPLTLTAEGNAAVKGVMASPLLADVDGNCYMDIVAHSRGGTLYYWDTKARVTRKGAPWPTSRLNNTRTAAVVEPKVTILPPDPEKDFHIAIPFITTGPNCFN